jgi:arsenate reductase
MKKRVLFLCTHNSARSQMAEGLLRDMAGERFDSFSAGTEQTRVHPLALHAMGDAGIDISHHRSKTLEQFLGEKFDYVITVCDRANESCPVFHGAAQRLHWSFEDPSAAVGTEEEQLEVFGGIRDEIRARLEEFISLESDEPAPHTMQP